MASASVESIELSERFTSTHTASVERSDSPRNEQALAPVDRGFGAWSFLAAAFLVETIVWGVPTTFGVFLAYYLNDPQYANQKHAASLLPLIGTLSSGIIYCSGPIIYPLISRYPFIRRKMTWLGTIICWTSLFGASYTRQVKLLVFLQGVLYAIGGSLLYAPCISYMSEWFVERRGFANGVIFAGTAMGGLVLPLLLPVLIKAWGTAVTLRILSFVVVISLLPVLSFIRGRLPETRVRGPAARTSGRSWARSPLFWTLVVVNTLQGFAYFVPIVWLPTFAISMKADGTQSSLTIALLNGASVVGRLTLGTCADRYNPWLLALTTLSAASGTVFVLWGILARNIGGLIAFGIAYGVLAGGWSSLWTGFLKPITKDDPMLNTTLFGFLLLSRGIGNVLSTPISTALFQGGGNGLHTPNVGFNVDGGKYQKMIVYVGTCFAGAAVVSAVGWGVDKRGRR